MAVREAWEKKNEMEAKLKAEEEAKGIRICKWCNGKKIISEGKEKCDDCESLSK
ncbi:MAG: hypothetical protein FWD44_09115 [Oscillospiraceae bacterium]|nr:hypothetical protein [Oscillospiraceae bacterium]